MARKKSIQIFRYKCTMTDEEYNVNQKVSQAEIDAILDKISASGYSSLTQREKDILFQYSNKK